MTLHLLLDSNLTKQQEKKANQASHDLLRAKHHLRLEKELQSSVEQADHHELLLV